MEACMNNFQNNKEMFFRLLPQFEKFGFLDNMNKLAFATQAGDFLEMRNRAHSIKGSAGYVGADKISVDCNWIQVYFEQKKYVKMVEHYQKLLPHAIEFRYYWRDLYFDFKKEKCLNSETHKNTESSM